MSDDLEQPLGGVELAARYGIAKSTVRKLLVAWADYPHVYLDKYVIPSPPVHRATISRRRSVILKDLLEWEALLRSVGAPLPGAVPRGRRKQQPGTSVEETPTP